MELHPQAAVRRRLPADVAVRGVRLDRARREHDPAARGPAAQAGFVRQGGADGRDPPVRRRRQRRRRAPGRRRPASCSCAARRCSPTTTSSTTSSRRTSRDGFQTVGDIAYRDDEGFIYICDRKKDMIISGGMNIYPAEIEAALEAHPDIYEAAVFGIPSEEWGETVHAVVVKRPGTDLDEQSLTAHAREHLAGYKVPRSISWMDELPKTGSGKILKRELRAPVLGRADVQGLEPSRALGVRDAGRPAQRRQVVARQRHLRREGQHRLGQAADHPPPRARHAHPARRPARVRRHARPAQAGDRARPQGQRHGDRAASTSPTPTSTSSASCSTPPRPFGAGDRWVAGHLDLPRTVVVVNKIDRAGRHAGARPAGGGRRARRRGLLPGVGAHR